MNKILDTKIFNIVLILTITGEFVIPWLLKYFYPQYDSKKMVMSALGTPASPARYFYNVWLIWLGVFLLFTSIAFFYSNRYISNSLSILISLSIAIFAIGAGLLSGVFSVNESKEVVTISSKIHGIGAAIGFMALLFFPLLNGMIVFKHKDILQGVICIISFILAIVFFIFFIMGDKENLKNTILSYEGIWQRLSLFYMYIPFIYIGISKLFPFN